MKVSLSRSQLRGELTAPPSKSYTIRALMCAALAEGRSEIAGPLDSDDTLAAVRVLEKTGVGIFRRPAIWLVKGGNLRQPEGELFCGDSAATLRFMTAICSGVPGKWRLTAGASLSLRPMEPLLQALRQLGVECSSQGGLPPVTVKGGPLEGGLTELPGNVSSQFVSALLLIAPLTGRGISIRLTTPLESEPYVAMTIECMKKFGVEVSEHPGRFDVSPQAFRPARYEVEGDWSSASYFLALGAANGEVTVKGLNPQSLQSDRALLDFLRRMGASLSIDNGSVTVKKSNLSAISADLTDCIDLLPTAGVLAALANGTSELTGVGRARLKESDRVAALESGLRRMGIRVESAVDSLRITGSIPVGSSIDSRNDHRIAMAFSILGTVAGGTTIEQAECVSKTFPAFWSILEKIGGRLKRDGK